MKKLLIATALAGAIVGTFASLGFAASLPTQLANGRSPNIVSVDYRCGPGRHIERGFYDRFGRWIPPHCARDFRAPPPPPYYR